MHITRQSLTKYLSRVFLFLNIALVFITGIVSAQQPSNHIKRVKLSPDGAYFVASTASGAVTVYDETGIPVQVVSSDQSDIDTSVALEWNPDGTLLAIGGAGNFIHVWDTKDWEIVHEIETFSSEIFHLSWQPSGELLLASGFNTFYVWDTTTWDMVLEPIAVTLTDLVWSPDGSQFAFGGSPAYVGVASISNGNLDVQAFAGHQSIPYAVDWSPDGKHLVSAGGRDGTVRLWDTVDGSEVAILLESEETITDVLFLDAQRVAAATEQGNIYIINIKSKQITKTLNESLMIRSLTWNTATEELIIGGAYREADQNDASTLNRENQVDTGLPLIIQQLD